MTRVMSGFWADAQWAPRPNVIFSDWELNNRFSTRGSNTWKNVRGVLRHDIPYPACGDNQVIIRVGACGICGSDASMFMEDMDGYMDYASQCSFPCIPGHEFSGEIVQIGAHVTHFKTGDYVTAENIQWCGRCNPCHNGDVNQCQNRMLLGFDRDYNGAFADYIAVDERYCWSINCLRGIYSEEAVLDLGALVEPTCCAFEALVHRSRGFVPGNTTVILGAGATGLASLQLLRSMGASKIIVLEPISRRRELALIMGADYAINPFADDYISSKTLMELTDGHGIDLAIEASPNPAGNFPIVEKAMRYGGEILCIGMAAQYPRIDYMACVRHNLSYTGSYGHAGHSNFGQVIKLMQSKRIDMLPCITAHYPLAQIERAIEAAITMQEGKIIVRP